MGIMARPPAAGGRPGAMVVRGGDGVGRLRTMLHPAIDAVSTAGGVRRVMLSPGAAGTGGVMTVVALTLGSMTRPLTDPAGCTHSPLAPLAPPVSSVILATAPATFSPVGLPVGTLGAREVEDGGGGTGCLDRMLMVAPAAPASAATARQTVYAAAVQRGGARRCLRSPMTLTIASRPTPPSCLTSP